MVSAQNLLERLYPGRRAALKRQILLDALDCFLEHGIETTSIEMIRAKSETSVGAVYHHFKNKKELYLAVIEELTSRVQEELVPIVSGNASVEEKLYQLIKVLLDEHPTNLFLMLNDMFQEMGPDYNRTLYQIFKKTYINNIAAIFESEPETNCLQEGISVDDATRFILYNVSALLSIEKTYQRKTVDDDVKKFIQFMLHGVLKSHK